MGFKNQMAPKTLGSWTVSKYELYEECPRKAKYKHIDKLPDEGGPALERGSEIHGAAEDYIAGRTKKLHADLQAKKTKAYVELLRTDYKKNKTRVELQLAFTRAWKACHWLAKDVYVRFKVDAVHLLKNGEGHIIDWKTGKYDPKKVESGKYDDQLHGYAVALLTSGLAKSATARLWFTDADQPVERPSGTLTLAQLPAAQKEWDGKVKAMLADTKFPMRPGVACRWCPYSKNKGGPCRY